jgi:ATP-dependent RNA helicase RhlE
VFTRTKHGANRLSQQLERAGIRSAAIHGNKSQAARTRALADFKAGKLAALVATEVASRGLDIRELPQVVNYELPNVPEDYVHRIGRTARAGSTGAAISLVSPDELSYLRDIEKLLKRKIDFVEPPKFEIKEGTHQPRNATGEHEPHQDPRRRPEHRRSGGGGRPNHSGGGRHGGGRNGGGNRGAGRADHSAYTQGGDAQRADAPRSDAPRSDAQPGARPHGGGNHGGGNRHGGQGGRGGAGGGRHKGGGAPGASRGGSRGGFARGARSGGGRSGGGSAGGGQSGGGQSGSGNGGGFSRMT